MTLRLIHAADLHLDSPLAGLGRYDAAQAGDLRGASRRAFVRLVDHCLETRADALLLAGDIWDGDWPDVHTGLFFTHQIGRLERAGMPVVMIRGNHDAASRITRTLTPPSNLTVLSERAPQTIELPGLNLAIHGQSFARPDVTDNLAAAYPPPLPGRINIGLLHTALDGHADHARYAPCSVAELKAKGYHYWALGHVHDRTVIADGPGGTIAYSGVLQGRHVRETGPKGAWELHIADRGLRMVPLDLDVGQWLRVPIDLTGCETMEHAAIALARALDPVLQTVTDGSRFLALRLEVGGHTALHGRLELAAAPLRDEVLNQLARLGASTVFLEKIQIATHGPDQRHDVPDSAALDILAASLGEGPLPAELAQGVRDSLRPVLNSLPAPVLQALRASDPDLLAALEQDRVLADLADQARAALAARLSLPTTDPR